MSDSLSRLLTQLHTENLPDELSATFIAELWEQDIDDIYHLLKAAVSKGEITPSRNEPITVCGFTVLGPYMGQPMFHKGEFARWALLKGLESSFTDRLFAWLSPSLEEMRLLSREFYSDEVPKGGYQKARERILKAWIDNLGSDISLWFIDNGNGTYTTASSAVDRCKIWDALFVYVKGGVDSKYFSRLWDPVKDPNGGSGKKFFADQQMVFFD